jgi:hypothetical protein
MREFSSVRGPQSRATQRAATPSTVPRSSTRWPRSTKTLTMSWVETRVL